MWMNRKVYGRKYADHAYLYLPEFCFDGGWGRGLAVKHVMSELDKKPSAWLSNQR